VPADLAAVLGTLDPTSDRAVFRQIADHLREAIEKGRLAENEKSRPRPCWSSTTA